MKLNNKYDQILKVELGKKDKAFLITANGQCYQLHNVISTYSTLTIIVKSKSAKPRPKDQK